MNDGFVANTLERAPNDLRARQSRTHRMPVCLDCWFSQSWLALKIVLVLILSGIHGALTGKLRRATNAVAEPEAGGQWLLPVGLALVTLIVLLVTIKP